MIPVCTVLIVLGNVVFADQPTVPNLIASSVTHNEVELTWTSSTGGNAGHLADVLRCQGASCIPDEIVGNNILILTFTDTTVSQVTNYCYSVEETHAQDQSISNIVCIQTVAFNNPPTITILGDNPLDIEEGIGYLEEGASAIDIEDGNISGDIVIDSSEFIDTEGEYDIFYDVTDSGGKNATQQTRLVRVCPVGEAPNPAGICQAFQQVPEVDIFTEQDGASSILVTWLLPIPQTADNFVYNYDIERSDDNGQNWTLIGQQGRNVDRKVIDHTNDYREIYHYLDTEIFGGSTYIYKVKAKTGQGLGEGNIKYSIVTNPIRIPTDLTGYLIKADGFGIQTTTSGTVQPPLMLGWFAWIFPNAFGYDTPIFTSLLNPQGEVFEIDIEPVPIPTYNQEQCQQFLDIAFKRNQDNGQKLQYVVTILENDVPRHQFVDTVQITAKRTFNNQYYIPFQDQVITDFENISIQVDVNSQVGEPRSFELHSVDFYVPEDNGAC